MKVKHVHLVVATGPQADYNVIFEDPGLGAFQFLHTLRTLGGVEGEQEEWEEMFRDIMTDYVDDGPDFSLGFEAGPYQIAVFACIDDCRKRHLN